MQQAVARELLLGRRESLTIASHLQCPVEAVNAALNRLHTGCGGCITLTQPYGRESRLVVGVVDFGALGPIAWPVLPEPVSAGDPTRLS